MSHGSGRTPGDVAVGTNENCPISFDSIEGRPLFRLIDERTVPPDGMHVEREPESCGDLIRSGGPFMTVRPSQQHEVPVVEVERGDAFSCAQPTVVVGLSASRCSPAPP